MFQRTVNKFEQKTGDVVTTGVDNEDGTATRNNSDQPPVLEESPAVQKTTKNKNHNTLPKVKKKNNCVNNKVRLLSLFIDYFLLCKESAANDITAENDSMQSARFYAYYCILQKNSSLIGLRVNHL